jgi:DNA mismatch repair protein MutS2
LRGRRLEDAREAVEAFFDACLLRGEPVAYLLHGHGTGALKSGLRAWLPRSRYVRRWRPAAEGEGGDAWTVVELA